MIRTFLIEDNHADVKLIRRALTLLKSEPYELVNYGDGEEAYTAIMAQPPDLIILDLNIPKVDGKELLKAIRANPATAVIPVIILTTSNYDGDIQTAYALGANAYVVKPIQYREFMQAILSLGNFWLNHVRLK